MDMTRRTLFSLFAAAPVVAVAIKPAVAAGSRPALTYSKLPESVQKVANEARIELPVRQVVEDALRHLGALGPHECASAAEMAFGKRLLEQQLEAIQVPQEKQLRWPLSFQCAVTWALANQMAPSFNISQLATNHMAYVSGYRFSRLP